MTNKLNVVGGVLVVVGGIWFLQGIGVLPGSYMNGQIRWAIYGGIAMAVGTAPSAFGFKNRRTDFAQAEEAAILVYCRAG